MIFIENVYIYMLCTRVRRFFSIIEQDFIKFHFGGRAFDSQLGIRILKMIIFFFLRFFSRII